jgi:hypothetical protein
MPDPRRATVYVDELREALSGLVRLKDEHDAREKAQREGREWEGDGKEHERKAAAWDRARAVLDSEGR